MRAAILAASLVGVCGALPDLRAADRLILRDLTIVGDRTVSSCDEDGVRLDDNTLLTWDRVERGAVASELQPRFDQLLEEIGQPLYRLRLRLRVGDDIGLAPFAEALAPRFADRHSVSSYLVQRGLMRSRLAQGRREAALEPYLRCLAYVRQIANERGDLPAELRLPYDSRTGLTPELAPIWFDDEAARAALTGVRQAAAQILEPRPDGVRIYFATLALAAGDIATAEKTLATLTPAIGWPDDWRETIQLAFEYQAQDADPAAASNLPPSPLFRRLTERTDRLAPDCRPIARYWLGLAGLRSADPQVRLDAVLQLVHLPAAADSIEPELAAAALAAAARGLRSLDDSQGAATLQRELNTRYPSSRAAQRLLTSPADSSPSGPSPASP